ncbi:MAG: hypothetical protein DI526_15775 [Caulobacter segnis]|uniref:Uncharacterized protein n=2 Tax=Caulobacter segnis TaxID=88688 RepID=A0A2W5UY02_9CAUL|nr:MAG: hypothetical protein DI526_15775 [Caulobacter segnis]
MRRKDIGTMALPYGAAIALVVAAWLAGGLAGAEATFGARAGIAIVLVLAAFIGWLATMFRAARRLRVWAFIALPSVVLVVLTATGIPSLMGACILARACI